jgi:glycosyltransferase involved in cell wall biosynthesis
MATTVLVDAWHLGGFSSNRGIGTYLRNLLPRLAREPDLRVVALTTGETSLPEGVLPRRISRPAPNRFAQRQHDLLLPFTLARAARAAAADLVFSPADNPPRRSPRPWVQTLHDLIPMVVPAPSFEQTAKRWRRVGPRLRSAAAVITDSHSTAADAIRILGLEPGRVHVAHLGVGSEFWPPVDRVRTDPPTILYVGEYGPHKGFAEAFAVAGGIADAGLPHRLAMGGFLAPWHEPTVRGLVAAAPRGDRIDLVGFVRDLVALYQQADALIVTSRYEGFCLPALEAMACGTPVIAFANSALVEVVGGGGVLTPDGDVPAMVAALRRLLEDPTTWEEVSARGVEHARRFSWESCANVHADVFRHAASARPE